MGTLSEDTPQPAPNSRNSRLFVLVGVFWLLASFGGIGVLITFATAPGRAGSPNGHWPLSSRIRQTGLPSLIMLAHPRCPCTRASIEELSKLMARLDRKISVHVLLVRPNNVIGSWERTDLWQQAAAIPGVTVLSDPGGVESARFGAHTSGQVFLYNPQGQLLFTGGITRARGHIGDNAGRDTVLRLVRGQSEPIEANAAYPVFGCPLTEQNAK